jgi:hypothetical protein
MAVEVDSLVSDLRDDERIVSGGTRGKDSSRQEREVDRVTDLASQGDDAFNFEEVSGVMVRLSTVLCSGISYLV